SPEKFQPEFPGRLRFGVELFRLKLEMLKKMAWKSGGRALADANDPNFRTAQNGYLERRQPSLECECGNKAGTASSEHYDSLYRPGKHGRILSQSINQSMN